ncbi:MAG TPA: hypothetical protein VJ464_01310 [Blastocatellia bacterium]|nr:hypothetical protein [Blastocatellia bacterium]
MSEIIDNYSISIIYDELETVSGSKGLGDVTGRIVKKIGTLDTATLASNLTAFCKQIGTTFEGVTTAIRDYELHGFELAIEVTAKGEIRFIGSATSELKGGLKLIFTKQKKD